MNSAIALIPTDLRRGRLGHAAWLSDRLGPASILEHTLRRAARVEGVTKIVLVHPVGQDPLALVRKVAQELDVGVVAYADGQAEGDAITAKLVAARKWAPHTWRGGLGGATCFDELLPAGPLARALRAHGPPGRGGHPSAFIVRADWCLFDPALASAVLARHLSQPEAYKLVFTQAPPGLCGVAMRCDLLEELAQHGGSIGGLLAYHPTAPAADPIGREPCVTIPHEVRDCAQRFVYDTPHGVALLRTLADTLGNDVGDADAMKLVSACTPVPRRLGDEGPGHARQSLTRPFARGLAQDRRASPSAIPLLPTFITLELTPRRELRGPITPQHYVDVERPDLDLDLAVRLIDQISETADACLLLRSPVGGDALLHPQWDEIVLAAKSAGVTSVGIDTDLLCDAATIDRILALPIDLVTVRLNADTAATYERIMGADRFGDAIRNLERLLNGRAKRGPESLVPSPTGASTHAGPGTRDSGLRAAGLPWVLPRMIKTRDTLAEMETFFDKWTYYAGHAVIEPATCGCGLMPDLSPVPMAPPSGQQSECRQLGKRLTILSDGTVAQCDQDWLGRAPLGDAKIAQLLDLAARMDDVKREQRRRGFAELTLCGQCSEWHRV